MTLYSRILRRPRPIAMLLFITIAAALFSWKLAVRTSPLGDAPFFTDQVARTNTTTDQTIAELQKRLSEFPKDGPAHAQLGLAYLQKARETGDPTYYQKVETALQTALKYNPDDYAALCGMGTLALAQHQFAKALDWGEQAHKLNPDNTYAYGVIADGQIELGLYSEAVSTLQAMVNLRPDMSSYARISYIRELYGQPEQALEMMQWAADAGMPQSENGAWTRTQLALLYYNQGDLENAEVEYQRTLAAYPGYPYALAGLGRIAAARGDFKEAARLVEEGSAKIPLPEFIILQAEIYQAAGQPEAAQRQIDLMGAIQQIYQANGVDTDLEMAMFHADYEIDLSATVDQARKAYSSRQSIYAADVLAWALYQSGEYEEARQYIQLALRLGTRDAMKLFHAGMISYRLSEHEAAQKYLEEALAINPYFSIRYSAEARQTLENLQRKNDP